MFWLTAVPEGDRLIQPLNLGLRGEGESSGDQEVVDPPDDQSALPEGEEE